MRCPIVFRGVFIQPIGPLNPGRLKMTATVEVELYLKAVGPPAEWRARRPNTRTDFKIASQSTFRTLQNQMDICFETQVGGWVPFDGSQEPIRRLVADDWGVDSGGRPYLTEQYREKLAAERQAALKR